MLGFSGGVLGHARTRLALSAVAAAGLVLLAPRVGLGALIPLVVLVGTMGLLRLGESLLDRLVIGVAILVGATTVAGLALSVWPWRLDPVPVGLAGVAGLTMLYAVTARSPSFPRPRTSDLTVVPAVLATWWAAGPYVSAGSFTERLALAAIGEDNARHMSWFDAVGHAGGYLFLTDTDLRDRVIPGAEYYPQGWHLTAGLLDGFLREPGGVPGPEAFDHYLFWLVAVFGFLVLTVLWLAVRLSRVTNPAHVAALGLVGAVLAVNSGLARMLTLGYPAQATAVALAAVLTGVLLIDDESGGPRSRESVVVVAALLCGISFSYYLVLPGVAVAVGVWLALGWRRLRRHSLLVGVTALATGALVVVMPLQRPVSGEVTATLGTGGAATSTYLAAVVLGAVWLVPAVLLPSGEQRMARQRWPVTVLLASLAVALVLSVLFGAGYYAEKSGDVALAVAAAGVASLVTLVPVPQGWAWREWLRPAAALLLVCVAAALASGSTRFGPGLFTEARYGGSMRAVLASPAYRMTPAADAAVRAFDELPPRHDTTAVVVDLDPWVGYRASVFLASLEGTAGRSLGVQSVPVFVEPDRLRGQLAASEGRVRLLATSPEAADFALGLVREDPDYERRVRIITLDAP